MMPPKSATPAPLPIPATLPPVRQTLAQQLDRMIRELSESDVQFIEECKALIDTIQEHDQEKEDDGWYT